MGKGRWKRSELFRLQRLVTESGEIDCVFRDHGLSDRIGFVYRDMDPKEAAKDFITNLKRIGTNWRGGRASIGECDSRWRKLLGVLSAGWP